MKTIRALARGLEVINVLNENHTISFRQLMHKTGLPKATLLRILKTLEGVGWIYHCRANGDYRLHSSICELGDQIYCQDRLIETAAPILDDLYTTYGYPSDIAICTGFRMRILESTRRFSSIAPHEDILDCQPHMLPSALGRAYLAFCSPVERKQILENLRGSLDRFDRAVEQDVWVRCVIEKTRRSGFGMSEADYWAYFSDVALDVGTIAVPVKLNGQIHCCVGLWMEHPYNEQRIVDECLPMLRLAADKIESALHRETSRHSDRERENPRPLKLLNAP